MTRSEILDWVKSAMCDLFELEPAQITYESTWIEDLDLDSIDAIDILVRLQEMSGRRVDEEVLKDVRTISDIVDLIERHLEETGAG